VVKGNAASERYEPEEGRTARVPIKKEGGFPAEGNTARGKLALTEGAARALLLSFAKRLVCQGYKKSRRFAKKTVGEEPLFTEM